MAPDWLGIRMADNAGGKRGEDKESKIRFALARFEVIAFERNICKSVRHGGISEKA
jgi:hypothetical protein